MAIKINGACAKQADTNSPWKSERPKSNQQVGTELHVQGGNKLCEAGGKEIVNRNESEGKYSPEIILNAQG